MVSDYTPTPIEFADWIRWVVERTGENPNNVILEYRHMIDEVARAAAEKAWDEGRMQGVSDRDAATCEDAYWVVPITDNPYRLNEGEKQ